MDTVVLRRSAVIAATDLAVLAEDLGSALARYRPGSGAHRVRAAVSDRVTAMVLVPGMCDGIPAYTVKVHTKVPGAPEAIRGVLLLHNLGTGDLMAILDSGWLTAQRTALSAAFVHDRFTDPADPVAILGAGVQGQAVAHALATRRARRFVVTDTDPSAARDLAAALESRGCRAEVADDARAALTDSPSAVTATWGSAPVAAATAFSSVRHVTMLGADEPGKQELPDAVLDQAAVFADDPTLVDPVLDRATSAVQPILNHDHTAHGPTVYAAVGLPMQDVVAAWHVHQRAIERGLGTPTVFAD